MTMEHVDLAIRTLVDPILDEAQRLALRDGVTLHLGCGSPSHPLGGAGTTLLLVPAAGPGPAPAWVMNRIGNAGVVGLLDRSEAIPIRAAYPNAPAVLLGLPRPEQRKRTYGLDPGMAPHPLLVAWAEEIGAIPDRGAGVTWINGFGAVPVARAALAWAEGRAVVALPGTMRHPVLRSGGVLYTDSPLEVLEATTFLRGAPALVSALASRGRRATASLPMRDTVMGRLREAIALTEQHA